MPQVKIISSEVIHTNPWWEYCHDVYERANGTTGEHYYGNKPAVAVVVPILTDGRLLLIRQYRYIWDAWKIEFPAGHNQPGESILQTAERELAEETGCDAIEIIKVGQFNSPSFKNVIHVFIAKGVEPVGSQRLDETEEVEIFYRRVDEFSRMIINGEVTSATTLSAWALVRERLAKSE